MKKGLSILLIAAALFGFYGSAVNLNDVLACKDYWEKAGEESTANMNKLEDGLNQLKENEQAYLDGKDQVSEGEKTLADGEKALADGEKALADGEAQYAAGLKSYKEAPAKLAAGEAQLAEGKSSYKNLKKLINGLETAKKHGTSQTKDHAKYWHDAYSNSLMPGRKLIISTLKENEGPVGMIEGLVGESNLISDAEKATSAEKFDKVDKRLEKAFGEAAKMLDGFIKLAGQKANDLDTAGKAHAGMLQLEAAWSVKQEALGGKSLEDFFGACTAEHEKAFLSSPYATDAQKALLPAFAGMDQSPYFTAAPASTLLRGGVAQQLSEFLKNYGATLQKVAAGNAEFAQLVGAMQNLAGNKTDADTFGPTVSAVVSGLNEKAVPMLKKYKEMAENSAKQFGKWDDGYQTLAHAKDGQVSKKYKDDLASKSSGVPYAFKNIVSNSTTKAAVKAYDKGLMKILRKYTGNRLANDSMAEFDKDIVYLSTKVIPRAEKVLAKVKKNAEKQLADGEKQLAKGKADYAAAPGKLAAAEKQLAAGRQQLEEGRQQLEEGRQALADGKAQLAQYEDGEQQVRDGLATLTGTEPDLGLESIADRLSGDVDFDNGDEHLELDEGLSAVETGRGYQAEDGVLITNEIMGRAVGTGALLGAGVLAVLAAILSFLKKNKAAGVFAILAAAAGAFGAFYGTNAGTYFSDIAGSTAGNAAWIAAGTLGAVALVHAIVHFAAKKEA